MSKNGADYEEMKKLQKQLTNVEKDVYKFKEDFCKEIATRLLSKLIKNTTVGSYGKSSAKKGGTLRRGWTGQKNQNVSEYINGTQVTKVGNKHQIKLENSVEYASYVEFGHRKKGKKGWVEGKFILTKAEKEIEQIAPALLEKRIKEKLINSKN